METEKCEHWRIVKWYEEEIFDLGCSLTELREEINELQNTLIDTEKAFREEETKIWEINREFINYLNKKALENEEVTA